MQKATNISCSDRAKQYPIETLYADDTFECYKRNKKVVFRCRVSAVSLQFFQVIHVFSIFSPLFSIVPSYSRRNILRAFQRIDLKVAGITYQDFTLLEH
jgi:hypothetical protein